MKTNFQLSTWLLTLAILLSFNVIKAETSPPHTIKGKAIGDLVSLSWKSPASEKTLQWHKDYAYNGFGASGNFPMTIAANEFAPDDLQEFIGMQIEAIGFYPYYEFTYDAYVLIYEDGTEVVRQAADFSNIKLKAFNKVELDEPYLITGNKTVRIAVEFHHGDNSPFVAIVDNGPVIDGKGNLYSFDGKKWLKASGNFLVTGYFGYTPEENNPDSYNIYRNDVKINSEPITELTFEQTKQPLGINNYAITAIYGESESEKSYAMTIEATPSRGSIKNLDAEIDNLSVELSWEAPFKDETLLTWSDQTPYMGIGFTGTAPKAIVVNSFSPDELSNYIGAKVNAINIMFKELITGLEIVVFENKKMVYNEVITDLPKETDLDKWIKYEFTTPYIIPQGKDISVGYYVTHVRDGHPIYVDSGTSYAKDRIHTAGTKTTTAWKTLDGLNASFRYNWMLSMDVELNNEVSIPEVSEYKVFRNGKLLSTTNNLSYLDESLDIETYSYQVSAVYTDDTESNLSDQIKATINLPTAYRRPVFTKTWGENNSVELEWELFTEIPSKLKWYTGDVVQKYGITNSGNDVELWLGAKFDKNDLLPYDNHEISSLEIFLAEDVIKLTALIYENGELVVSQNVENPSVENNIVELTTPYSIPKGKDIIIGYKVLYEDDKKPLAFDMGPLVADKGSLFSMGGTMWFPWSSIVPELQYNLVVEANVREVGSQNVVSKLNRNEVSEIIDRGTRSLPSLAGHAHLTNKSTPDLSGFNIYKNNVIQNSELLTENKFEDKNVGYGVHEYYVTAIYSNGWESHPSDLFVHEYKKPNFALAPYKLEAEMDNDKVMFSWNAPGQGNRISWNNDMEDVMAVGLTGSGTVKGHICTKFEPEDLKDYPEGSLLTHIEFELTDDNLSYLSVCVLYNNAIIYEQPVETYQVGRNTICLDNPIVIHPGRELTFGYYAEYKSGVKPYATDTGPAIDGKGNMISTNLTTWRTLKSMNSALDFNWRIWGYIQVPTLNIMKVGSEDYTPETTYNFYRNDELLVEGLTETTFEDEWQVNDCVYYVKAVKDGIESAASNLVDVDGSNVQSSSSTATVDKISIYPIPATDYLNIRSENNIISLQIIQLDGSIINTVLNKESINISDLASGPYLIKIETDKESVVKRFIKE